MSGFNFIRRLTIDLVRDLQKDRGASLYTGLDCFSIDIGVPVFRKDKRKKEVD